MYLLFIYRKHIICDSAKHSGNAEQLQPLVGGVGLVRPPVLVDVDADLRSPEAVGKIPDVYPTLHHANRVRI